MLDRIVTPGEVDAELLFEWCRLFIQACIDAGYVEPPFRLHGKQHDQVVALYQAGLTPEDAAHAVFATRH